MGTAIFKKGTHFLNIWIEGLVVQMYPYFNPMIAIRVKMTLEVSSIILTKAKLKNPNPKI